jgi:hypothetical protein
VTLATGVTMTMRTVMTDDLVAAGASIIHVSSRSNFLLCTHTSDSELKQHDILLRGLGRDDIQKQFIHVVKQHTDQDTNNS